MNKTIQPIAEVDHRAREVLIRELGIADTLRFLGQFRTGMGDYTVERRQRLDDLSLEGIVKEIKTTRRKPRRTNG